MAPRNDPSRPPNLHGHSEFVFVGVLGAVVVLLGVVDVAGALASWLDEGPFACVAFPKLGRFLVHAVATPGRLAAFWPGSTPAHFPPALFWTLVGLELLLLGGAVFGVGRLLRRSGHRRFDPPTENGFASRGALNTVATFEAAARRAPQTRPSLGGATLQPSDVGYPLGRSVHPAGLELRANWEASLQLIAPTSAGKTMRVLAHVLRQHPGPAFATSTKGDFYEVSVAARRRDGRPVYVLDPEDLVPAAPRLRWSPVLGCEATAVAERRAAALVAASGDGGDVRNGGFFRQSAIAVLGAYLHAAALSGGTMADVVRWAARPTDSAPRRILTEHGDENVDWASRLVEHTTGAEETTSGVMRTVDLALSCFRHPDVLSLCIVPAEDAFDFDAALEENATVYALGKDRSAGSIGVGALITAFAEEMFLVAERRAARQPGRRLDPPLLAVLDEAPSIVPLPGLPALIADGRGRGITVVYSMQSFSQAVERWGAAGASTMRNATTITAVFGGLSDVSDIRELSDLCGTKKVLRHSASSAWRGGNDTISASWDDQPVLTQGEIRALPEGQLLLLWGSLAPIIAYQPGVWEIDGADEIAKEERAARIENDVCRQRREEEQFVDLEPRPTSRRTLPPPRTPGGSAEVRDEVGR